MRKALLLLVLPLAAALFTACGYNRIYEDNINLGTNGWKADSALVFTFNIPDAGKPYDLYYNIRTGEAYPFCNLFLRYTLSDTLGHELGTALEQLTLSDCVTGKPYGSGIGDRFDNRRRAIHNYRFPAAGTYRLKVRQYMRQNPLPEIYSLGLKVAEAEK